MSIAEAKAAGPAGQQLNPQQQQAVDHASGPLRIMAGAGTGKTKTLTARVVSLIERGLARPETILALTFTNKAAAEMAAKARKELRQRFPAGAAVAVMTYNAFGYQIVREHASLLGLPADPLLLSEAERAMFLKSIIDELPLDCFDLSRLDGPRGLLRQLLAFFDRWRDENADHRDRHDLIGLFLEHLAAGKEDPPATNAHREQLRRRQAEALIESARIYQDRLRGAGAIDFGAQIALAVRVFREHPEALAAYRQRYRWLLVDEYQDTNYLQAVLVRQLAGLEPEDDGDAHNITIVGDPDQSIYAFRGAARDSIVDFPQQFAGAACIDLTLNYRSTQPILDAANQLLESAPDHVARPPLTMPPESPAAGKAQILPGLAGLPTAAAEEAFIAATIRDLRRDQGYSYRDFAILLRKNNLADRLYDKLTEVGIPVYIDRGQRLFDCAETRGLMAYLRALVQPEADADLARAMLMPRFGLTEAAVMDIAATRGYGESLFVAVKRAAETAPTDAVARFAAEYLSHHALQFRVDVPELIATIAAAHAGSLTLQGSGNFARLQEIASEWLARAPRLPWASGFATDGFGGGNQLGAFCDYLDVLDDNDESPEQVNLPEGEDAVQIVTAHAAKGLEWPVVFIARCNQRDWGASGRGKDKGYFPPSWGHRGPIDSERLAVEDQAEEYRLFYVALTRARERLYLTWAAEDETHKRSVELYDLAGKIRGKCEPVEPAMGGDANGAGITALTADFCRLHLVHPGQFDLAELRRQWDEFWRDHGVGPPPCTADWLVKWNPADHATAAGAWQAIDGQALPDLPAIYSYTHLETYEECPQRFNLTYILHAPAKPARTSSFGSAVHRAVAAAAARLQAGDSLGGDAVRSLIAREVAAEEVALTGPAATAAAGSTTDTTGALDRVVDTFLSVSPDGAPVGVELEFYAAVGGAVIHGFIDRLDRLPDGTYRIIDYKTHARPWSEDEARRRLQIPLYILGCRAIGYDARQGELVFLRHGRTIAIRPDEAALNDVERRVGEIVAAIGRREFPGRPGEQCRYCPHADFCGDAAAAHS